MTWIKLIFFPLRSWYLCARPKLAVPKTYLILFYNQPIISTVLWFTKEVLAPQSIVENTLSRFYYYFWYYYYLFYFSYNWYYYHSCCGGWRQSRQASERTMFQCWRKSRKKSPEIKNYGNFQFYIKVRRTNFIL